MITFYWTSARTNSETLSISTILLLVHLRKELKIITTKINDNWLVNARCAYIVPEWHFRYITDQPNKTIRTCSFLFQNWNFRRRGNTYVTFIPEFFKFAVGYIVLFYHTHIPVCKSLAFSRFFSTVSWCDVSVCKMNYRSQKWRIVRIELLKVPFSL